MSTIPARTLVWLLMLVFGVALPPAIGQPETRIDLRPKFEKGQQVRLKMEVTNTSTPVGAAQAPRPPGSRPPAANEPNAPPGQRSRIELGLRLKVQSVAPDRTATVDLVFDSVKMATKTRDLEVDFDSTKPSKGEEDLMCQLLEPLVGSTLTLTVDKDGNIKSVTGGEAFGAIGQFLGSGGGAGDLFGPLFSIKKGNGLVSVGESWEDVDRIDNSMLGKFKMTTKHTLRSAMGGSAEVDMSGRIEPDSEAGGEGVAKIRNSRYSGKYSWDTIQGMVKQMDSTMSVELEQDVGGTKTMTRNEAVTKVTRIR